MTMTKKSHYDLFTNDNIEIMSQLDENSIDSCITDPPYGIGIDKWDSCVPRERCMV
jgi:DNA modification methylase